MRRADIEVRQRARIAGGEVQERRLEERAVFPVEVAVPCRDVSQICSLGYPGGVQLSEHTRLQIAAEVVSVHGAGSHMSGTHAMTETSGPSEW